MSNTSKILIFIDDDIHPIIEVTAPVNFELDTSKLTDGPHILKIIGKDPSGKEGIRTIPFIVRNGPAISIEGLEENEIVDGVLPLMVNAYGKGDQKSFLISGSETPQSIPSYIWILVIIFAAWSMYYLFRYLMSPD